jgi:hypothetical protein
MMPLAGEPRHRRAADVLGDRARPAGGDQGDQALGDLGGTRVAAWTSTGARV